MANTEGMPDEAINSLFGSSISGPTDKTSGDNAARRRRRAIEERMEMSMGDRPAARVIRSSKNNSKRQQADGVQQQEAEAPAPTSAPIIGSIVERKKNSQPQAPPDSFGQPRKRQSKFAQQQRLHQGIGASATGFPSTKVPLGTFVKPKKKSNATPASSFAAARATAIQPGSSLSSKPASSSPTASSLREAASHEADAMLAQMSTEERIEKVSELQASLSAETIAFLRNRAASKANSKGAVNMGTTEHVARPDKTNVGQTKRETEPEICDSTEEKQRIAKVLSNIKTVGDLDAAFQAEMGDYSPIQSSEIPSENLWAAQIVSKRLKEQWERGDLCSLIPVEETKFCPQTAWPYPRMLPASLRCLLDSSISHTNGYVLHTYVLQALYNLLRLRACVDHVVDVDGECSTKSSTPTNFTSIYQTNFLEDAVPTPPVGSVYESIANIEAVSGTENAGSMTGAAAYKTSSSSKSAQKDGDAFSKDPMWTLLTRMCIIPRLAQLLRTAALTRDEELVPKEAIVASCGILAMLSHRSPGAATAVVHHQTLLKDLVEVALMPRDRIKPYDPVVALPAIQLLCALARQSRIAAEGVPFDELVPPIVAIKATTAQESELQKWCITYWRILLRYGCGLVNVQTMITIAAAHFAMGNNQRGAQCTLTTEFASSFANILQCLQVARRHIARVGSTDDESVIPRDQVDAVANADMWLSASAKQAITQLQKGSTAEPSNLTSNEFTEHLKFTAAQLQFLAAFLRTSQEEVRLSTVSNGEFKDAEVEVSDTWISSCQETLAGFVEQGVVESALSCLSPSAFAIALVDAPIQAMGDERTSGLLKREAAACAFICSFASLQVFLLAKILNDPSGNTNTEDTAAKQAVSLVVNHFANTLHRYASESASMKQDSEGKQSGVATARRGWLNRACFAVLELLNTAKDFGAWVPKETELLRTLHFTLVGRLERGDEAMATVLFSQDGYFRARQLVDSESGRNSDELASMFFREMCRTSSGRVQLDHSFKLKHGPGITSEEVGAFRLRSLLSDTDLPPQDGSDILLPVGTLWLWQVLSSPIRVSSQPKDGIIPAEPGNQSESANIVSSSLALILELERLALGAGSDRCRSYASNIPAGAKVYHLMNICLQAETTLQNDSVTRPVEMLLEIYLEQMNDQFGLEFAKACVLHSDAGKKKHVVDSPKEDESLTKTEKLASKLLEGHGSGWRSLEEKHLRTVIDFTGELCEAYIEYGAQYDMFTTCVRSFTHPTFPPRVRIQAISRLGDVLNRISLAGEDDATSASCRDRLTSLLGRSIAGALPSVDCSARDAPEFLDGIASIYRTRNQSIQFGYSFLFNVMVHARHLAICCELKSGFDAAKKRLLSINLEFTAVVVDTATRFLKSPERSKDQLVVAAMNAGLFWESTHKTEEARSAYTEPHCAESLDALKALM